MDTGNIGCKKSQSDHRPTQRAPCEKVVSGFAAFLSMTGSDYGPEGDDAQQVTSGDKSINGGYISDLGNDWMGAHLFG